VDKLEKENTTNQPFIIKMGKKCTCLFISLQIDSKLYWL